MKLLLVIHNQHGTGPYPKVLELARALEGAGATVTLLCTSRTHRLALERADEDGVRVVRAPDLLWGRLRQGVDPWNALRRAVWMGGEQFDVVHAIDCRPAVILPALWARRRHDASLVLSWWDLFGHGGAAWERSGALYAATLGRIEQFFEDHFRRYADGATVISTALEQRLTALGYPREWILLQRLGCDPERYPPIPVAVARAELGLPAEATILCYVGALAPADFELLLAALERVRGRGASDIVPLLVGAPAADPPRARQLGIHAVPRQPLSTVHRYICASDLCLLPLRETPANRARWPSKSGDYFNAGRPVVATRVGDFDQLFPAHGLGFLAAEGTAHGFADAITRALEARASWPDIGAACRRFAERELDVRVLARQLLAFYARVRDNRRGTAA